MGGLLWNIYCALNAVTHIPIRGKQEETSSYNAQEKQKIAEREIGRFWL